MKKILLSLVALGAIAHAGIFTTLQSVGDEKVKPVPFQLDVYGWNARGYVFSVPSNQNKECIIIYTESDYKAPVMQCYDKKIHN